MSASVVEQILARIKTVLTGTTRAGTRVYRTRQSAFGQDELPAINILRAPTDSSVHAERLSRTLCLIEIELHEQGDDWETAVDAFHGEVHTRLHADAALAALGRGLSCTGTDPMPGEADYVAGKLTVRYQLHVLTRPGDLTRAIN